MDVCIPARGEDLTGWPAVHKDAEDIRERRSIGTLRVDDRKDIRDGIHDIVDEGDTTDDTREWDVERDEKDDERNSPSATWRTMGRVLMIVGTCHFRRPSNR